MAAPFAHFERRESMRKLMWFSLGFAVSCGLGAYAIANWAWVPLAAFLFCWIASRKWQVLKPAGLMSIGCAAGILWFGLFSYLFLSTATALDGQTADAEIQITDYSYETNYGCAADGMITLADKNYQVRVYVNEDNHPCLVVRDSGMGIKAADAPHVFDRFYRSDPARSRQSGGAGLGLAIADWIVTQHGGHMEVYSWEGIGSRFMIVL